MCTVVSLAIKFKCLALPTMHSRDTIHRQTLGQASSSKAHQSSQLSAGLLVFKTTRSIFLEVLMAECCKAHSGRLISMLERPKISELIILKPLLFQSWQLTTLMMVFCRAFFRSEDPSLMETATGTTSLKGNLKLLQSPSRSGKCLTLLISRSLVEMKTRTCCSNLLLVSTESYQSCCIILTFINYSLQVFSQ